MVSFATEVKTANSPHELSRRKITDTDLFPTKTMNIRRRKNEIFFNN